MITRSDLEQLCDDLDQRIVTPDMEGPHCDNTLRHTLAYLSRIKRLGELQEFKTIGHGACDCEFLLNFPGDFEIGANN